MSTEEPDAGKEITQIDCGNGHIVTNPQIVADMLEWGAENGSKIAIGPTGDDPIRGSDKIRVPVTAVMDLTVIYQLSNMGEDQLRQLVQRAYGNLSIDRPQLTVAHVEKELQRLLLIAEVTKGITEAVESLSFQNVGTSLAYLVMAILNDDKFQVPVDGIPENVFYQLLLDTFADGHPVFNYLQVDRPPLYSDAIQEDQGDRQGKTDETGAGPEHGQDGTGTGPG